MAQITRLRVAVFGGLLVLGLVSFSSPAPAFAASSPLTTAIVGLPCSAPACPLTDTATLTPPPDGGRITYYVYPSGDCTGTQTEIETAPFSGSSIPSTGVYTITIAGTYSFQAVYTYPAGGTLTSDCEPFTVSSQPSGIPEFPIGVGAVFLLAIPLLLYMNRRQTSG
jgi:hypothetical protein